MIEHVENPWELMREIYAVLETGGIAVITTPNITSFFSRVLFMINGRFHQFDEADLSYGHISPITAFELDTIMKRIGLKLLEITPGGYLPVFDFSGWSIKTILMNFLRGITCRLARGHKRGWVLIAVAHK